MDGGGDSFMTLINVLPYTPEYELNIIFFFERVDYVHTQSTCRKRVIMRTKSHAVLQIKGCYAENRYVYIINNVKSV